MYLATGAFWGGWGVTYWLRQTGIAEFQIMDFENMTAAQNRVMLALKVMLLAGMLALAWRRRKLGGMEFFTTLGAAFTWILVFAPGAGPQYMVWFAPFILIAEPRWWAALDGGVGHFHGAVLPFDVALSFPVGYVLPEGAGGAVLGAVDESGVGDVYCAAVLAGRGVVSDEESGGKTRNSKF